MNRVYKVIWSKAKHCYVVTSEIARSVTKSASSARSAGRKGAAVLAMAALLFTAGGVLGEAANVTDIKPGSTADVIMVTIDGVETPITINDVDHAKEADYATAATNAYSDGNGLVFESNYAKIADIEKDYVKKTDAQVTNLTASGRVTAGSFTDGTATMSNGSLNGVNQINATGNIVTTGNLNVQGITATGDISGKAISGTTITGTTGSFANEVSAGSVNVTNKLEAGSIEATGHLKGNSLEVTNNASVGGQLSAGTLTAAGNKFTVGADGNVVAAGVNAGAGTIKTTGAVETGALHATGNATVDGNTEMKGTLKAGATTVDSLDAGSGLIKTDGTVKAGDVQTGTLTTTGSATIGGALTVTGKLNMDEIDMNKNGIVGDYNVTSSTKVAAGEITSYKKATSTKDGSEKESAIDYDENGTSTWAKATDADGKKNKSTLTVEGKGIKSTATDGKNKASTNLSNNGFNTFASDGTNKTYTKQTAKSLTSQIGDDGKVKSVMNADGITNNADGGTITNDAKYLVNKASGDMTNTVGGKLLNDVTGDMENKVGGKLTTTVTGDSSLTAENIKNEAKNKITNTALDVETDAKSSIVNKVSNDAGSNTSTQLSYQTTEEMSQTDGKTASYLRGAAEEKSQLTDGDKKTTIDTIAGQTNTSITDGKNISNSLQKADQAASSVTDGKNTTVVDQKAGSIASSITDGTKANNTNNTVDKSEQLIKADDTHYYAETKTAGSAVEALKSDGNTIIIGKDAAAATVSSAVTDGTNTTGSTMTAKGITNSAAESIVNEIGNGSKVKSEMTAKGITNTAKDGTITNDAKDLVNNASENMTNTVGKDLTTTVGGNETHAVTGSQTVTVSKGRTVNVKGTETENFNAQVTNIKTDQRTSVGGNQTNIVAGNQQNTVSGSKTETVKDSVTEKYGSQATTVDGDQRTNVGGNQFNVVKGNQTNTISGNKTETVKGEVTEKYGSLTTEVKGESKLSAANITNSAKEKLSNSAADIENIASKSITDKVGDNVERTMTTEQIQDKVGKTTVTTTDGLTKLTDEDHNHTTEMDYANVTKDLSVERNTTLGKEGEDTNLTVNSKSEFKDTVKMDSTLEVDGESTFNNKVTITKGGLAVTGGTTTDTLNVTGETRTGTLHVKGNGYVDGDLNVKGNIETHDAELSETSRQVVTGRQLYQTNERVDRLDNRIKKVGANAAALAALRPGDFNPDDKFSIAAGFGSYRNASAAALGLFYRPNENVLLSLGTSFGDGENMVNAGVSVKFGRGKSMAERRKEMADEVSGMRDEMKSQNDRIAELEEMLKKQSELIEKLSKES